MRPDKVYKVEWIPASRIDAFGANGVGAAMVRSPAISMICLSFESAVAKAREKLIPEQVPVPSWSLLSVCIERLYHDGNDRWESDRMWLVCDYDTPLSEDQPHKLMEPYR